MSAIARGDRMVIATPTDSTRKRGIAESGTPNLGHASNLRDATPLDEPTCAAAYNERRSALPPFPPHIPRYPRR